MENKQHPIQLKGLMVRELFIRVNDPKASREEKNDNESGVFSFGVGHSGFDSSDNSIDVAVEIVIGNPEIRNNEELSSPFDLKVHMVAKFFIDINNFPEDQIEHWAENNATLILHPYVREHVYALTIKAGVHPVLLPLMQVPTISVKAPKKA